MEILIEQVAEICALLKVDAVVDILIVVFLFMIFVCLAWIRNGVDHIHDCINSTNANNINDIKLIHKNHNKDITPPVKHPPTPRGIDKDCNHEWHRFSDQMIGDEWYVDLYCPICKTDKRMKGIDWIAELKRTANKKME